MRTTGLSLQEIGRAPAKEIDEIFAAAEARRQYFEDKLVEASDIEDPFSRIVSLITILITQGQV